MDREVNWLIIQFFSPFTRVIPDTLRSRQKAAIFHRTFSNAFVLNKNVNISITISLKFVPNGTINNVPALV